MNGIQNNFSLFFSYFIVHKSKYVIVFLRQKFGTISIFKLSVSQITLTLTVRNFNFLDSLFYFLLGHAAIVAPMRHGRRTAVADVIPPLCKAWDLVPGNIDFVSLPLSFVVTLSATALVRDRSAKCDRMQIHINII